MINKENLQNEFTSNEIKNLHYPLIRLYDMKGIGVIITFPSGVLYSNQTGGYSCLQPIIEGVYFPIDDQYCNKEKSFYEHFTGAKWKGTCSNGIDIETADFIDSVLQADTTSSFLRVDKTRLEESHEAWIYVNVFSPKDQVPIIAKFGERKGILTWSNSD